MPKSMAWSPFPGGTLFMGLLSFLMPVPFPDCTCAEVWHVCWVGREERAHKAGAGERRACVTSWLQCECGRIVHLPSCCHPAAPRAAQRCSLEGLVARELGAEQGPLSLLGAVSESSAAASTHTFPCPRLLTTVPSHSPSSSQGFFSPPPKFRSWTQGHFAPPSPTLVPFDFVFQPCTLT